MLLRPPLEAPWVDGPGPWLMGGLWFWVRKNGLTERMNSGPFWERPYCSIWFRVFGSVLGTALLFDLVSGPFWEWPYFTPLFL